MLKTQSFLKKILFLSVFVLILTASNCGEVDVSLPVVTPGTGVRAPEVENLQACQFYNAQSLIIACYRDRGFWSESVSNRKNIITAVCVKQAFRSAWGVNLNRVYTPESQETGAVRAWFVWGNLQAGNPPQGPPSVIEQQYYRLLNAFKSSIDTARFSSCLGIQQSHANAQSLIVMSEYLITQGSIRPAAFVQCYQEQLDRYKNTKACSDTSMNPHLTSPGTSSLFPTTF